MNLLAYLRRQFEVALAPLTDRASHFAELVRVTQDPKFGDYQANCAMPLAKELGTKPRDLANQIVENLPDRSLFSATNVDGPGFINLRLADDFLARLLGQLSQDPQLGIERSALSRTVIVDYSSPNVAKPMHVGHLRSTIIGDALARIHRALGATVIADNHLGDWGKQFGMLIVGWRNYRDPKRSEESPLEELARLYKLVNQRCEQDPQIEVAVREETAKLHAGDPANLELWRTFMPWCLDDLRRLYQRLGITFDQYHGESFYQPMLEGVVVDLIEKGVAQESDGAICVFFPDPDGRVDESGNPIPLMHPAIIRKADGAFNYMTSDLACIQYRAEHLRPELVLYVVDDRQSDHFKQLFEIARRWGYDHERLIHVAFGKITDRSGRPFKTREGDAVNLDDVLNEAVVRARAVVEENSPDLEEASRARVAEVVGIGAVKYGDLAQNRVSDYVFDWDKMINLRGNTATYLQYAYARVCSIFRKGGIDPESLTSVEIAIQLQHPNERQLGIALARFPEFLAQSAADLKPNVLTGYLFDLANAYSGLWENCPVLQAESEQVRHSRLVLCALTARILKKGLELLGIGCVERM